MKTLDPNSPALSEVQTPALVIDGALLDANDGYHVMKGDGTLMHWPIIGRYRTNRR